MSILGTRVVRVEDPDLLTIGGKYVDDLAPADAVHLTFVRSVMAHALITSIDTSEAASLPGVVGVFTATDLGLEEVPPSMGLVNQKMLRTWLASDRVRYVGDPIVAIASETRQVGVDAAELVFVDYEPLDAVVDPADALEGNTLLYPNHVENNICFAVPGENDDSFFDDCEVTVTLQFKNPRLAVAPIEPRSTIAKWSKAEDGTPQLTQWATTQGAHGTRDTLAGATGTAPENVRVICPDVGGAFGGKNGGYPEDIVVSLVARVLDRPVRWHETRSENMTNMVHSRGCDFTGTLGGDRDGTMKAFRHHTLQDGGAYPAVGSVLPFISKMVATGVYKIPKLEFSATAVVTNTTPMGAYRGAGRPEATHAIERMVDVFAAEIGMDPGEVRRKNFIQPEDFPYANPAGANMDSGEYEKALDAVLSYANYTELRAEQERRREDPSASLMGLGFCSYVEIANPVNNGEFGSIEVHPDGSATVLTGSSSHGQGHHTAFAQVAADLTGIPFEKIEVRHGDTAEVVRGGGTGGSKSLQVGGSAVYKASEGVIDRAREVAATMLEANPDDIVHDPDNGTFAVTGTPARALDWGEIATHVNSVEDVALLAEHDFAGPGPTFPFGVHLSVIEIDRDTGQVTPLRHIACDDAGIMVNPMIVDGQVHGGVASGIAAALAEVVSYDEYGNPQTGNFMDYAILSAAELPSFERLEQETPTPLNPLGAKGIGESGTIGATPSVQNAVVDALAHLGVTHIEMPTTPERVWRTMNEASRA